MLQGTQLSPASADGKGDRVMGSTITEKIIAAHCGRDEVKPGQLVNATVDLVMINDLMGAMTFKIMERMGAQQVFDPRRVAAVHSHIAPSADIRSAEQSYVLRQWAKEQDIVHYFPEGSGGIEHVLLPEQGLIAPGELIVGADSHSCTYGAFGTFASGMGTTDIAAALALGETWLRVPETIKFELTGTLQPMVTGKDLILFIIGQIGLDGARYKAMEFTGEAMRALPMEDRMTVTNMVVEAGGKNGVFEVDASTAAYLHEHGVTRPWTAYSSDTDAQYDRTYGWDVSALDPLVAKPFLPSNIFPVTEVQGVKIDQVFIGSCTNGKIDDLRQAARVLAGKRVAKHTRVIITPATHQVYLDAVREGLVETFLAAGATVTPPTCGACAGLHLGVLGAKEVCISTTNRNFRGRMGHVDSQVYLANPYVAAASAISGEITDPRTLG
jgi:3-isopropylmalate/(R)-2-methylmalate dehydratase large subunit